MLSRPVSLACIYQYLFFARTYLCVCMYRMYISLIFV